ncbi:MAG: hypothetical protein H6P94_1010, partial [Thermoplasmatales archaeon]|nr:hypothetical protein [Thermoplasmatales archaeon]
MIMSLTYPTGTEAVIRSCSME